MIITFLVGCFFIGIIIGVIIVISNAAAGKKLETPGQKAKREQAEREKKQLEEAQLLRQELKELRKAVEKETPKTGGKNEN